MAPQIIFLLLPLLLLLSSHSSSSRRILHQPFFPVIDSPPPPPITTQTPSPSPSPSLQPQPQPKHPFSSLTPPETDNNRRFFPSYTSPPESSTTTTTVPSTSLPTFPANISSIILPSSSSSKSHVSTKLLLISLAFSLLAIAFIAAVVVSLVYHRNHSHKPPPSDSLRLFPANLPTSDKPPPPPTLPSNFSTPSSEFLYLGTLVSPLHDQRLLKTSDHMTNASASASAAASAAATSIDYNMLGSPELHPLPPLPRQDFHHQHNLDEGSFSDSEVEDLGDFFSPKGSPVAFQRHKTVLPPSPPPPPPPPSGFSGIQRKEEILKPKLKPLQWDNVRASSEKATTWDHFKLSSFQLNEEMIQTLFMSNSSKLAPNPSIDQKMVADVTQKNIVLDPHKSRNIVILLRALDLTIDEVCESILQGNVDTLDSELLGSLLKMAPTMEEETRLKEFDDLDPAEKFLKAVIQIPFAFKRVDAMLYILNFDNEVEYLKGSFKTIEMASRELRNSRMFIKLLDAVLMAGTQMNDGTTHAWKLDTLLKLVHVKGNDGKTTLLHFVVQEIIREEGFHLSGGENNKNSELCDEVEFRKRGLEVVSSLGGELSSVKKAAAMDSTLLSKEVERLAMGLTKVGEVVDLNEQIGSNERFSDSMNVFLKKAKDDLVKIVDQERLSISMVKEATEYFHGEYSAMEEGEALRIFTVVREFLSVLDRVCKEVGKMNERSTVGIPLPLRMSRSLPVFPKFNGGQQFGSSDGEDESVSV